MKKICVTLLSLTFVACMIFAAACAQVFTVTFDGNGGVLVEGEEVITGKSGKDLLDKAPEYYREGYTFEGWDTAIQYITEDCTVKARWKMWPEFKITLDANGGTFNDGDVTEIKLAYGDKVPALPTLVREDGYSFVGWKIDSAESGETLNAGRSWDITRNVIAYAVWVEGEVNNINWNLDGGTLSGEPQFYRDNETVDISQVKPTKTGYAFKGWNIDGDETVITEIKNRTGEITIVAKWEAEEYTISFDANGATATVESIKVKYGSVPELPSVERENYVFAGWNTEKDGSGNTIIESAWKYAENLTVYAKWETRGYSITYNLNGGSFDEGANVVRTYKTGDTVLLPSPKKAGRGFLYWREVDKDGKPISGTDKIEQINSTDTGDKYFVAIYSKIYTVKLSNTDIRSSANAKVINYTESIITEFTVNEGEKLLSRNIPKGYYDKNDNYKIDGWIIVVNGEKKEYNNETINDEYVFGTKESSETEIVIYPKLKNLWVGPY